MEYLIDIDDESIVPFIRKIDGVYDIEEYSPNDEAKHYKYLAKESEDRAKNMVADYRKTISELRKELIEEKEKDRSIPATPDYMELISLKRRNEELIFWEKIVSEMKKEIDIEPYIRKANGL